MKNIFERSNNTCELCGSTENLSAFVIPETDNKSILCCQNCKQQITGDKEIDVNHWRLLNESIWSEHDEVKIVSYRMLHKINTDWTRDLLDMMYLEDEVLEIANSGLISNAEDIIVHKDVNGVTLNSGDAVVLIKDLKVKGSSIVAKQGTAVRNIRLDHNNEAYIEGKVNGQQIVIITKYVKKI